MALFVHGIATNAYLWRNVISALITQRKCIAVDLPLHGHSPVIAEQDLSIAAMAAGLDDFCDALGLTRIDLVANDTGGAIAQIFAARHSDRLATLTLTNCDTGDNLPLEAFKPMVELAAAGTLAPSPSSCSATSPPPPSSPSAPPTNTRTGSTRRSSGTIWNLVSGPWSVPVSSKGSWPPSTLVIWWRSPAAEGAHGPHSRRVGTGDAFFDVSWAYWLQDTIPGVTHVVTVDDARLLFPEERPMDLVPHLEQHWSAATALRS